MKRFLAVISFVVLSILLSFFGSLNASAASVYDDVVHTTDSFNINCYGNSDPELTSVNLYNWYNLLKGTETVPGLTTTNGINSTLFDTMMETLDNNIDNQIGWGVSIHSINNSGWEPFKLMLYIGFNDSSAPTFYTQTNQAQPGTTNYLAFPITSDYGLTPQGYAISITCASDQLWIGQMVTYIPDNAASNTLTNWSTTEYRSNPIFLNFNISYPSGYEGEEVPEAAPEPPVYDDLTPDIYMHSVINFKGEFSDRNFLTTDQTSKVLCTPGDLVPAVNISLYRGDEASGTPIDSIVANASSVFNIDFKAYAEPHFGDFTIVAQYFCGEGYNPVFTDSSTYTFSVDENGFLINEQFEECIKPEFPYVDFQACWDNVGIFINYLSFDKISFAPDWRIQDNGCRTLSTMGDWLNAEEPNRYICPQFPTEVRATVTPFVTFILGIVTLGIIVTKSKRDMV